MTKQKVVHKYLIVSKWDDDRGTVFGIDPIDLPGALGMTDELYELLCRLSTCAGCGEKTQEIGQHEACDWQQTEWSDFSGGLEHIHRQEGVIGLHIPPGAYFEHFYQPYVRDLPLRGRTKRAYRLAKNGGSHTKKEVCTLLKCQQHRCYYCNQLFDETGEGGYYFHRDHMQALCAGGANDIDNIVLACSQCNLIKGGNDCSVFIAWSGQKLCPTESHALKLMHQHVEEWKAGLRTNEAPRRPPTQPLHGDEVERLFRLFTRLYKISNPG